MFDILVPARIIFGSGTAGRLGEETLRYGQRALLVTGKKSLVEGGGIDRIYPPLRAAGVEVIHFSGVDPEPTVKEVDDGRELVRKEAVNVVIGVGGGSALDVAKAVAGLAREEGETIDYFNGRPITRPGIPFVAVPTTAGSGAEVTKNSVLVDPDTRRKQSIRSDLWMARSVIVDPILTFTAPRRVTAHSGMDAFTHALESFTSRFSNPVTEALSWQAILLIARNIYTAFSKGHDKEARENMALGSLMAGMAFNNSRLGAVHGLAHPIGVKYGLPHGLVCAILLPYVIRFNLGLCEQKYARVARELGVCPASAPDAEAAASLVKFVSQLIKRLEIPAKLGEVGLAREDIPELVRSSLESASLAANPRAANYHDLTALLEENL